MNVFTRAKKKKKKGQHAGQKEPVDWDPQAEPGDSNWF